MTEEMEKDGGPSNQAWRRRDVEGDGTTVLDAFAMAAMPVLLRYQLEAMHPDQVDANLLANLSYKMGDAMMRERQRLATEGHGGNS